MQAHDGEAVMHVSEADMYRHFKFDDVVANHARAKHVAGIDR